MENLNLVVLRSLLSKRGWFGLHHIVKVDTFQSSEYRQLFAAIERMHDGTEDDILPEVLAADIETTYQHNEEQRYKLLDMIQLLEETPECPADQLTKLVTKFLQRSIGYSIAEYVTNHVEQESFDANAVADLAARAVDVSDRVSASVTDLFETGLSGAPESRPARISLGLSRKLDSGLRGGTGPGELCLYLAPPATGKTSLLIKSGAAHAQRGGGVLHITLEINTRKVVERYDQAWTSLGQEAIQTEAGQKRVQDARYIVQAHGGQVHIVDWSYMQVTSNDIGALVRKLKAQGKKVTMVIVDYLGLMSPNKSSGREVYRQTFSAVGKEMRALARNLDLPVLSAWQVNREGSKKSVLGPADISESWDVVMIADTIIGLNQNLVMLNHNRMKLNIIKQRESTDRSAYELFCDLDTMTVRDITAEDHFDEVRSIMGSGEAEEEGPERRAQYGADERGGDSEGAEGQSEGESKVLRGEDPLSS